MEVIEVAGKKMVKEFHNVPERIYKGDPNYIPFLRPMIENTFNPLKNSKFENGDAKRWVLKDGDKYIGRIAAFYDSDYSSVFEQPTGCFGFFECVDNKEAAFMLLDAARDWLKENGMEAMDGPVNFGENFFFWGLLADGFNPMTFGMQYNPPYYQKLLEEYGCKTFYEQFSYSRDITNPDLPDRFWKIAAWVAKKPDYTYEHFTFKNKDKYIRDFVKIHELAWSGHSNYKPASIEQLEEMIRQAKMILEEEFIWYVYHKGNPVAFYMMIPDINQIISKLRSGNMNLVNIVKFLYYKKRNVISRCRVIVLGVVPQFQKLGIESGIFYKLRQVMLKRPWYNDMEMSWVGDFNPGMNALFKSFGAHRTLTHLTLRYLFDRKKEFVRAQIIK
ncbi:MAG: GNAT family N-acetyltransferase [Bacteroidales bacterium]|nr:GNAT family N-acetyltransferase [Bacteroidales bacterium]